MRTIAISNQKGGVGKTTSTINLGAALALAGRRVLLVDMDPQGQLGIGLGLDVNGLPRSIAEALEKQCTLREAIVASPHPGLELVPSNARLARVEKGLHQVRAREQVLRRCLAEVDGYDVCLIDTPPSLGLLTENALCAATELVIPTTPTYYALEGTFGILNTTAGITEDLGHRIELLGVFLNLYDPRTRIAADIEAQLRDYFGPKLLKSTVRVNTRLNESQMHHRSIFAHDPRSRGAEDYRVLAGELFGVEVPVVSRAAARP